MTRKETIKLMAVLKAAYPQYYKGMPQAEAEGVVNLWAMMFQGDSYEVVSHAVEAFIATDTKGFPPVIGQIRDFVVKMTTPKVMTEGEAWELVRKALSHSGYHAKEAYEELPDELRRIIGSPNMLREWAMVPLEELQTVVQSNFMRSYRARIQTEREVLALPREVREFMALAAGSLKQLEGAKE